MSAEVDIAPAPLLELRGVTAQYGRIRVLHGVDLVVPRGEVVALLGPNGAGKTTTLLVATGQHPATSGCVHVGGRHINGAKPDAIARLEVFGGADHDPHRVDLVDHAAAAGNDRRAGVERDLFFDAGADEGRVRLQERHGLTLHVRAHQRAVRVIVLKERD